MEGTEMSWLKKMIALLLILEFDAGLSLIVSYTVNQTCGFGVWFYMVNGAISFLPDFDLFWHKIVKKKFESEHKRTLWHQPWVMMSAALSVGVVVNMVFNYPWYLPVILLFLHFFHDSIEPEGVIAWNPFNKNIFYHLYVVPAPPFFELREQEIDDIGFIKWMEKYYMKVNCETVVSFILGTIGLALLIYDFLN